MFRALTANLVAHERIETTDAKAKELRRVAERLITKAVRIGSVASTKEADLSGTDKAKRLHVSRMISAYIPRFGVRTDGSKVDLVEKVLVDLTKRFEGRPGGYTRIIKIGNRRGDNAPISIIEFVDAAAPVDKVKAPPAADPVDEPAEEPAAAAG
jgi:large subunit ribosomal protein L17